MVMTILNYPRSAYSETLWAHGLSSATGFPYERAASLVGEMRRRVLRDQVELSRILKSMLLQ